MSRLTRLAPGVKRMALSGGAAGKGEYFFGAALAIVVVVALGASFYNFFGGGGLIGGPQPITEMHFKCYYQDCGHEFVVPVEELDQSVLMGLGRVDCPKCGRKQCSYRMTLCPVPTCKKYYVSPMTLDPMGSTGAKKICPHCKTDIDQFSLNQRSKKKK